MCCWMEAFNMCSKTLQNLLYGGTLKYTIFLKNMWGQPILIFFSQVRLKSGVWKTASFLSSCIPVFSTALEAI